MVTEVWLQFAFTTTFVELEELLYAVNDEIVGGEYALTVTDALLLADTLPRESVAVTVKVFVPDEDNTPPV